ncbi:MAG: hypothetical protein PHO27_11965 [Sulfuricurvum sp.]|jgi:hypothetical protein|nr:hypothetical protein [Sulfuricurvum sp.]
MKTFVILLILLFPISATAFDKWDKTDIALATTSIAVNFCDWRQTHEISDHPDRWRERNPILGDHPSGEKVDLVFAAALVGELLVAHVLPSKWWKI